MANLAKVVFPDEFTCRNVMVQLKDGDTAGSVKLKLLTKYAPKFTRPEEYAVMYGTQILNDDRTMSMFKGGKDVVLKLIRQKLNEFKEQQPSKPYAPPKPLRAPRVVIDEDDPPEPSEDPPPPPHPDEGTDVAFDIPIARSRSGQSFAEENSSRTRSPNASPTQLTNSRTAPTPLPRAVSQAQLGAAAGGGRKLPPKPISQLVPASPKSSVPSSPKSSAPSPRSSMSAQPKAIVSAQQKYNTIDSISKSPSMASMSSFDNSSIALREAHAALFSTTSQQQTLLQVLSEEFATTIATSPDTFGATAQEKEVVFELCARIASISLYHSRLCAHLSFIKLRESELEGLLLDLEPMMISYASVLFGKNGAREVLKNLSGRNTQLRGLLTRQLSSQLPELRDTLVLMDVLSLLLQLLPDLSLSLSRVVFALPKTDPLHAILHRCSQLAARSGSKILSSITAECRCCGKPHCAPCATVRGNVLQFSAKSSSLTDLSAKSKTLPSRAGSTEISHYEFIFGGEVVSKLKSLNGVNNMLSHLQALVSDPIIKLRDSENFDYFAKKDGNFSNLEPGRYIVETKVALVMNSNVLCRAYAGVRSVLNIRNLALGLGREHDLEYSIETDECAPLRYCVSLSHEKPFSVVVAIDVAAHMRDLLDARLEAFEHGWANIKALNLARLLPFVTLLELSLGLSPHAITGGSVADEQTHSAPAAASSTTSNTLPTLLFTGHQFGGTVAHLAALLARSIAIERELHVEVLAVGFSPVSCLGPDLAASFNASSNGRKHLSLFWTNDSQTALFNRCCDTTARKTLSNNNSNSSNNNSSSSSSNGVVGRQSSGSGHASRRSVSSIHTSVDKEDSNEGKKLIEEVLASLVQGGKPAFTLFESNPGLVHVPVFHPCGQCAFLNSKGELQPRSPLEALSLLSQLGSGGSSVPVCGQEFKFSSAQSASIQSLQAKPLLLAPRIQQVTTLHTEDFVEFIFKGEFLEPLLTRERTTCKLRKSFPSVPLLLNEDDFWVSDSTEVELDLMFPLHTKMRVTALQTATGRVCLCTDFGRSNECRIVKCKRTVKASSAAISAARVDASFFLCALVRALLKTSPRQGQEAKNYKTYLLELELLLLNTKNSRLEQVFKEFDRTKNLLDAHHSSLSIIHSMAAVLMQPVVIDTENTISIAFRKLYGALGYLASGVFYVVGGVAMIPAAPVRYAAKKLRSPGETTGGGLVGLPRVLFAAAQRARHTANQALQDSVSRQYAQLLGFLLVILNVDVTDFLEEIPTLEDEVMNSFNRLSLGAAEEKGKPIELWHATEEDVKRTLLSLELTYEAQQPKVYTNCPPKGQAQIERWLLVVGRMAGLRRLNRSSCLISFVGVHNAGKSTLIEKLFGFATGGDIVTRTEELGVYSVAKITTNQKREVLERGGIEYSMAVDVVDFPGASDERARIADMTPKLSHASSLFVMVFTAGHVAGPERRIVDSLKDSRKPYLIIINKRDQIQDELNKREEALRAAYAESLGVSPDFLFFVSSKDPKDVDKLRAQIFAVIQPFLERVRDQESMACALLRSDVRQHLECQLDSASAKLAPSAVLDLMYGLHAITLTEITHSLQKPRLTTQFQMHSRSASVSTTSFVDSSANSRLTISLLSMGASELAVLTTIRFVQAAARESLESYLLFHPELDQMETDSKSSDARFAHLLAAVLHDELQEFEGILLSRGFQQGVVRLAIEVACTDLQLTLDYVQEVISQIRAGQLVDRKYTSDLKKMEGLNHMRMLCRFVPPSPLGAEGRKAVANVPKICSFDERVQVFREYVKAHLEQARGSPAVIEIGPHDTAAFILVSLAKGSGEELRGGMKLVWSGEESKDAHAILDWVLEKVAQEITIESLDGFELRDVAGIYFSQRARGRSHLSRMLRGFGRLLGLAALHAKVFPAKIAEAMFKPLLDFDVTLDDLHQVDVYTAELLIRLCCMDEDSVSSLGLTFSASTSSGQVDLEPFGSRTSVTAANRFRYAKMLSGFQLCHDKEFSLKDFVHGFGEVLPRELLGMFTPIMLKVLLCNLERIKPESLLSKMVWIGQQHPLRSWFAVCLGSLDTNDLLFLLWFVTGLSSLPASGLDSFNILVAKRPIDRLPVARTSFKILELPPYDSADMLRDKLLLALRNVPN